MALLSALSIGVQPSTSMAEADAVYRPILITDTSMTTVKVISDKMAASRYVLIGIRVVKSDLGKKSRLVTDETQAVDCKSPRSIKMVSLSINKATSEREPDNWLTIVPEDVPSPFEIESLLYETLQDWTDKVDKDLRAAGILTTTPNALMLAVEYACTALVIPAAAREGLAFELNRTAGLSDTTQLSCEYSADGSTQSYSANVGFSASGGFFRLNRQWMNRAFVRGDEVGFANGTTNMLISRRTGKILVNFEGHPGKGVCQAVSTEPRKF